MHPMQHHEFYKSVISDSHLLLLLEVSVSPNLSGHLLPHSNAQSPNAGREGTAVKHSTEPWRKSASCHRCIYLFRLMIVDKGVCLVYNLLLKQLLIMIDEEHIT